MISRQHKLETFFVITSITAIVLFVVVTQNSRGNSPVRTSAAPPVETPIPTPSLTYMDSPEGSKRLTLRNDDATHYSILIASSDNGQNVPIYNGKISNSQKLEIPFNTWDPNNTYIFLKEVAPTTTDYLVFKNTGTLFPDDASYISIQEKFQKKVPNYIIEDVTGWAAPNLLIVNTRAIGGDQKMSFWFDVPSQSFIQLGTYFK